MSIEAMQQAMQQALEALKIAQNNLAPSREDAEDFGEEIVWDMYDEAIEALNRAIEQAEKQEPVAWVHLHEWKSGEFWPDDCFAPIDCTGMTPLYTAPPQREWVGLTMEDVNELYENYDPSQWYDFLRDVEAKLKEKNT